MRCFNHVTPGAQMHIGVEILAVRGYTGGHPGALEHVQQLMGCEGARPFADLVVDFLTIGPPTCSIAESGIVEPTEERQ